MKEKEFNKKIIDEAIEMVEDTEKKQDGFGAVWRVLASWDSRHQQQGKL